MRRLQETSNEGLYHLKGMYIAKDGFARLENHRDLVAGRKCIPRLVIVTDASRLEAEQVLGLEGKDETVLIEGVGHWPHQMKSEEINGIIGKWLDGLEAS